MFRPTPITPAAPTRGRAATADGTLPAERSAPVGPAPTARPRGRPPTAVLDEFLRDDGGSPLGRGFPTGRPLRRDGERHYDAWLRMLRADPCAYCGGPGGTVDHVEPRCRAPRGLGPSPHAWVNTVGACGPCNSRKSDRPLLLWLVGRR